MDTPSSLREALLLYRESLLRASKAYFEGNEVVYKEYVAIAERCEAAMLKNISLWDLAYQWLMRQTRKKDET